LSGAGRALSCHAGLIEQVEELDRLERAAIAGDDWGALERVLARQRRLWEHCARLAQEAVDQAARSQAITVLRRLYQVRVRNHALIERQTEDLRGQLVALENRRTDRRRDLRGGRIAG